MRPGKENRRVFDERLKKPIDGKLAWQRKLNSYKLVLGGICQCCRAQKDDLSLYVVGKDLHPRKTASINSIQILCERCPKNRDHRTILDLRKIQSFFARHSLNNVGAMKFNKKPKDIRKKRVKDKKGRSIEHGY